MRYANDNVFSLNDESKESEGRFEESLFTIKQEDIDLFVLSYKKYLEYKYINYKIVPNTA